MVRSLAAFVLLALALASCGDSTPQLDGACTESPAAIERALRRAPRPVALTTGTRLSQCVSAARSDGELQTLGLTLTRTADALARRAEEGDQQAALALGYLVGAARRGAADTGGIHAELQRRLERAGAFLDEAGAAIAAALDRGVRAGTRTG